MGEQQAIRFYYYMDGQKAATIMELDEDSDIKQIEKDFIESLDDNIEYEGYKLSTIVKTVED